LLTTLARGAQVLAVAQTDMGVSQFNRCQPSLGRYSLRKPPRYDDSHQGYKRD
jgi:hypothetical protein